MNNFLITVDATNIGDAVQQKYKYMFTSFLYKFKL